MQTNTNNPEQPKASALSGFFWRDHEPSKTVKSLRSNPAAPKNIGKPPPLLNGSARNATANINTEVMAQADKIRRLRRVSNVRSSTPQEAS